MAARRPLRIGLVGAGMVSRHHLEAWARIAEAQVVAVADPDLFRAEERARDFGIGAAYDGAESMLAAQACDALDIAAPLDQHAALCRLAAKQGAAILCQKPLAAGSAEAAALVAAVGGRVRFMVQENWRFRASYRQIKAWLDEGRIGRVTGMRLSVTSGGLVEDGAGGYPALRRQAFLADLPRLLVFEVLIHHIDVLRWLCGGLAVESAQLSRRCPAVRGEDGAEIRFAAEGFEVLLEGDLACPDAPPRICDGLTITGTEGMIALSDTRLCVEGRSATEVEWDFDALYASAFEGALRHFVACLAEDRAFETEAADNVAVLKLVEQVYAAAREGEGSAAGR